jgi:hypothetical protein
MGLYGFQQAVSALGQCFSTELKAARQFSLSLAYLVAMVCKKAPEIALPRIRGMLLTNGSTWFSPQLPTGHHEQAGRLTVSAVDRLNVSGRRIRGFIRLHPLVARVRPLKINKRPEVDLFCISTKRGIRSSRPYC